MKIEAEIENIKNILVSDEKFYQVPDYQRPYSWDKDNLSELIDDLTTSYKENKEENYFCGSLVLVNNEADARLDIIDGQQRTTSFTILACVIRDSYYSDLKPKAKKYINNSIQDEFEDNKRKLKFLTNDKYQIDFEETVLKGISFSETKHIERDFPDNKYLQNAHFLKYFLKEKINDLEININEFTIWLYESVVLTVITCPSQDSAIKIFNVLNDRGMPLSSIDILKSSLMQKLNSTEDRAAFKAKWENINTNLKFGNFELDSMLNTYLYYKIATNPKNRLDKELLSVFSNENKGSNEIIKEISDFSEAYINTLNSSDKYTHCLKYLKHKIYWTSIISTATFSKYKHTTELKHLLVAYYYQNWIAGATVARIKQTSFNILRLIKNNASIEEVKKECAINLKRYSTRKSFKEEVHSSYIYGRKWDRAILLLIEYFSSDDETPQYIPINNKLHLEHILPQTPTKEWKEIFDDNALERWTHSLANLTLLSMKKNIQAKNSTFLKKLQAYKNKDNIVSYFLVTQDLFTCENWDIEELEKRETRLTNKLCDVIDIF